MQRSMDLFSTACTNFGLTISTKKTEVMYQPAPGKQYQEPTVTVSGQKLAAVDKFMYLGSTLSRSVNIDDETNARIAKASVAFGRLRSSVWERKGVSLATKLQVYMAIVFTTLLYASETWTVYQRHAKKLNRFHLNCLNSQLKIAESEMAGQCAGHRDSRTNRNVQRLHHAPEVSTSLGWPRQQDVR